MMLFVCPKRSLRRLFSGIVETGDENADQGTGTATGNRNAVYRHAGTVVAILSPHTETSCGGRLGVCCGEVGMILLESGRIETATGVCRPSDLESTCKQGFFVTHDRFDLILHAGILIFHGVY